MNTAQQTDRKRALIRIYHSVCHISGMKEDDKKALLAGFGVDSSLNLSELQLMQIIEKLQHEPNMWRKKVIAAIGAWLRSINKPENMDTIKAIACRASSCGNFNQITIPRMRDVYYEFSRKAKTKAEVDKIAQQEVAKMQLCN